MKCDIIIPVGPGHSELVHRAAGSVDIAKDYSRGPFHEIDVVGVNDVEGMIGRSKARNGAVQQSTADWVFFLDADDLMHPAAFDHLAPLVDDFDAVWGKIVEYKEGVLLERYQVPEIDDLEHLLKPDPYLSIQMGHFVKREVAMEYPFNEDMNTGEDWEYYLRVWKHCKCIKIFAPLMCNVRGEHSTGPRSSNGKVWREVVEGLIDEANLP